MIEHLYHYTTIETLEMILSNRTIKFNSLDNLDDLDEGISQDATPYRRFIYISCWTADARESIPMWKSYATMDKGVRVKMRQYPFKLYDLRQLAGIVEGAETVGEESRYALKDLVTMFREPYSFNILSTKDFLFEVEYTDDPAILYPILTEHDVDSFTISHGKIGKHKNPHWDFLKEWRYLITVMPVNFNQLGSPEKLSQMVRDMLDPTYQPPSIFFTLDIDDAAFNEMEIVLSPNMSEEDKRYVYALKEQYNPSLTITDSVLTGRIRRD